MKHKNMGRGAGFSLVEVMVGMVIGLLGIIIITQIFALAEGQKRTTTGGADAQTNGNIAMYTIERDARQAGYGMDIISNSLGCVVNTPGGIALTLAPVIITDGGAAGAPDQLQLFYSTNTINGMPITPVAGTTAISTTQATIASALAVAVNDMVIFYEAGNCALSKVTGVAGNTFTHNSAAWSAGWPGFTQNATVYDFGSMVNRKYGIDTTNSNLQVCDPVLANTVCPNAFPIAVPPAVNVAGEIVNLQAQYGKDTNADNIVDTWDTCTPGTVGCPANTPANWAQILAVRIAILARSGQYEKPTTAGVCTATPITAAPTWAGGTMAVPGGLPSCYRYKVFETVVPLRNIIWG